MPLHGISLKSFSFRLVERQNINTQTPQLENGYLRIANELYEQIMLANFSKRELLVVLAIIRETYGYGRKSHRISGTQVGRMTGIPREHAARTIACLVRREVVLNQPHTGYNVLGLNKNYHQWLPSEGSAKTARVPKQPQASAETATKVVPNQHTTKDSKYNSKDSKAQAPVLPEWLNPESWHSWLAHLKEKRKTPTLSAQSAQIRKLEKYRSQGHTPDAVIEHSIAGNYQGLYPEQTNGLNGNSSGPKLSAVERVRRANAHILDEQAAGGSIMDTDGWTVRTAMDGRPR